MTEKKPEFQQELPPLPGYLMILSAIVFLVMKTPIFVSLHLDVPVPSLVRASNGLLVDSQASRKSPPAVSSALAEILNTPDVGKLLLGLNELFGSASEYAIGGSVALALHHRSIAGQKVRRPNDLDVVVSSSAMDRLSDLDHQGLSQLGFKSEPGNSESLEWIGQGNDSVKVDVVHARNSFAGRGFENRQFLGGVNVIPLQSLVDNLKFRVQNEPVNDQTRNDLASGIRLLNANKLPV